MKRVRCLAQLPSRSNPAGSSLLSRWSESIQSLRPPCKRKRITLGAIFDSANVSSKFIPSTAAAGSPSTMVVCTTPNRCRKFSAEKLFWDEGLGVAAAVGYDLLEPPAIKLDRSSSDINLRSESLMHRTFVCNFH